ncbi:FAD-dependent oxidoreductase [Arthrobacter sp. MDT2-16]
MTSIAVIGAGLAGSSAAWRLARAGHDVAVLEQDTPAHPRGSSHGSARIFRYAYAERLYVDLVREAARGWAELESACGAALLTRTGALDHGEGHDPEGFARILAAAGIDHELLGAAGATARWGREFETPVLWHPGAGVLDAESAVLAMLDRAASHGAMLEKGWRVVAVQRSGTRGYRVRGADGRHVDVEEVVVAAGGWLPDLLRTMDLPRAFVGALPPLEVRQEQAYHFPYADEGDGWPTFIHKTKDMVVYGLPGGRDAGWSGQKVAEYNAGRRLRSASGQDGVIAQENRQRVVSHVERYLPGLVPEPYAETTCLFTNTPTEDFVVDREDGLTLVSACSGHGAKFAPLLGELVLALVEGRESVPGRFRPSRSDGRVGQ